MIQGETLNKRISLLMFIGVWLALHHVVRNSRVNCERMMNVKGKDAHRFTCSLTPFDDLFTYQDATCCVSAHMPPKCGLSPASQHCWS
jgi:hypothetical protein